MRARFSAVIGAILLACAVAAADDAASNRDAAVNSHLQALESLAGAEISVAAREFDAARFAPAFLASTTAAERQTMLGRIQQAVSSAAGLMVRVVDGEYLLELHGPEALLVRMAVSDDAPFAIERLLVEALEPPPAADLTWDNAADTFDALADDGFSGVLHLARAGETVLQQAYGKSNAALGHATSLDTIYGIGSTPIDFTVAGIYLLAQDELLSLDDTVTAFFDGVPADKQAMTLRHLLTGRSGLPDFHHTAEDRDADLSWIDRDEAVRRILAQPLLFPPGEGQAHSHSAFGLAAAVIEVVSGRPWFDFLSERLFDPAGMTRTGMYGDRGQFELRDFAVGPGPSVVGIPNIPPNWGPTSWLVLGSGGMYSTLGDMLRFYDYVRSDGVFRGSYAQRFRGETVGIGGSERGFYLFHASNGRGNEALMLVNGEGRSPQMRALSNGLERLVMGGG